MAEDKKSLVVSTKVDGKGLKGFESTLKSIDKSLSVLNKKLGSLTKAFRVLSQNLKTDVSKSFDKSDKSIVANSKAMDQATTKATKLTKTYQNLSRTIASGVSRSMNGAQLIPNTAGGFTVVLPNNGGVGKNNNGGGRNNGGGGGANSNNEVPNKILTAGATLGNIGTVLGNAGGLIQGLKTAQYANMADVQSFRGGIAGRMYSGNFDDILAMQMAYQRGHVKVGDAGGTAAIKAQMSSNAFMEAAQGFGSGRIGVAVLSSLSGATGYGLGLGTGKDKALEAQTLNTMLGLMSKQNPVEFEAFHKFMGLKDPLLRASLRMKGLNNAVGSMEVGANNLLSSGESLSYFTNLADKYGGNIASDIGSSVLPYYRKGLDYNRMGDAVGGIQGVLQGNNFDRTTSANKMIEDAVREGVSRGIQDPQTLETFSSAIASANTTKNGGLNNAGSLAAALAGGMNAGNANMATVNQRAQGLNLLSTSIQSNPLLFNRTMAAISKIIPHANPSLIQNVSSASLGDIMGDASFLKAGGLSRKAELEIMKSIGGILISAYRSRGGKLPKGKHGVGDLLTNTNVNSGMAALLRPLGFSDYDLTTQGLTALGNFIKTDGKSSDDKNSPLAGLPDKGGVAATAKDASVQADMASLNKFFSDPTLQNNVKISLANVGTFLDKVANLPNAGWDDASKMADAFGRLMMSANDVDPDKVQKNIDKIDRILKMAGQAEGRPPSRLKVK